MPLFSIMSCTTEAKTIINAPRMMNQKPIWTLIEPTPTSSALLLHSTHTGMGRRKATAPQMIPPISYPLLWIRPAARPKRLAIMMIHPSTVDSSPPNKEIETLTMPFLAEMNGRKVPIAPRRPPMIPMRPARFTG